MFLCLGLLLKQYLMPRNEGMSVDVFFCQVVKTRRGGEGVSSFQEGTDMVWISEDSNIATQGKERKMRYYFLEECNRIAARA